MRVDLAVTLDSDDSVVFQNTFFEVSSASSIKVPFSIFQYDVSALQGVVKYLRDVRGLKFVDIARLLNRDEKTVWSAYHQVSFSFSSLDDSLSFPVDIFFNRSFSMLESLVRFLLNNGYSVSRIAGLLNRSVQTIYTVRRSLREKEVVR